MTAKLQSTWNISYFVHTEWRFWLLVMLWPGPLVEVKPMKVSGTVVYIRLDESIYRNAIPKNRCKLWWKNSTESLRFRNFQLLLYILCLGCLWCNLHVLSTLKVSQRDLDLYKWGWANFLRPRLRSHDVLIVLFLPGERGKTSLTGIDTV